MGINNYVKQAHKTAKEKGWWEDNRSALEIHALIHSEIAEATEAVRKAQEDFERVELVDAVIRIFDYFGYKRWDFAKTIKAKMKHNKTRDYRHGNKLY